jgi:hypothetical protein
MVRRWESWAVYTKNTLAGVERVGERRLRRHFTRRGARRHADAVTNRPEVIEKALAAMARGERPIFVDGEVRPSASLLPV